MTAELVGLGILGLLALALLIWAGWTTYRLGGADTRADEAEEDEDDAEKLAGRMSGPMPGKDERARAARRLLRMRDGK